MNLRYMQVEFKQLMSSKTQSEALVGAIMIRSAVWAAVVAYIVELTVMFQYLCSAYTIKAVKRRIKII